MRDETVQREVCEDVARAVRTLGWTVLGIVPSPIRGGDGNCEFLLGAAGD